MNEMVPKYDIKICKLSFVFFQLNIIFELFDK